ncbi:MAG: 16S rRNA (cytidine(1402)-2'-O)-methyltransferase [Bacteroidetes bacterium]|nr:16S rRNA (cytidine(1402)-2'-O)-methyltransferase [Bacteroidota bacterium]
MPLNLITTPIGNYADMTLRALRYLKESDYIICEEYKEASKLLKFFGIKKELKRINEHNENEDAEEIFLDLVNGKNISIISDAGTPVFADPGKNLLKKCIDFNIKLEFLHGPNSVLAAIVLAGFDISRFYYLGFLSPKSDIRKKEIYSLKNLNKVFVLLEAPYRLKQILTDLAEVFPDRQIFIGFDLTMLTEKKFRGTAKDILSQIGEENLKGEFVIVVDKV